MGFFHIEHLLYRYAAQQKILHDQQQQLRDQQRLIEDLQHAQKQALFQMQLKNIREGNGPGNPTIPGLDPVQDEEGPTSDRTASTAR